jgi:hypothetical protein
MVTRIRLRADQAAKKVCIGTAKQAALPFILAWACDQKSGTDRKQRAPGGIQVQPPLAAEPACRYIRNVQQAVTA